MKKFLIISILIMIMMIPMAVSADTVSATLDTSVAAQVISFTMTPTALGFGTVIVGMDSQVTSFTIANTGNIPIKVSAVITGSPLYTSCLQFQQNGGGYATAVGWSSPAIPAGGSFVISAKIVKPTAEFVGKIAGTLTFTSTADLQ